jgi:hypothetical protein
MLSSAIAFRDDEKGNDGEKDDGNDCDNDGDNDDDGVEFVIST